MRIICRQHKVRFFWPCLLRQHAFREMQQSWIIRPVLTGKMLNHPAHLIILIFFFPFFRIKIFLILQNDLGRKQGLRQLTGLL